MDDIFKKTICQADVESVIGHREELPKAIKTIIKSMDDKDCFAHVGDDPIHFSTSVKEMINKFRQVLFPGFFSSEKIDKANLVYNIGQNVSQLYDILSEMIIHVLRHDCLRYVQQCSECDSRGNGIALKTIQEIPNLRIVLASDV
jgi:serine O-acetyltransferase